MLHNPMNWNAIDNESHTSHFDLKLLVDWLSKCKPEIFSLPKALRLSRLNRFAAWAAQSDERLSNKGNW